MSKKRKPPAPPRRRVSTRQISLVVVFLLTLPLLGFAGYGVGQLWQTSQGEDAGAGGNYPAALTHAADSLAGASYHFTVEQLRAPSATPAPSVTPGASPSPSPSSSAGSTEGFNHFVTSGATDGKSFWQTVYALPMTAPISDYAKGEFQFAYLSTPTGGTWRNDGSGWYAYNAIAPGEGFDPVSAARLPDLLRHLQNVKAESPDPTGHPGLTGYSGQVDAIDYPGVVTSDGLPYTSSPLTILVWLDTQGRLARLEAAASNLDVGQDVVVSALFEYGDLGPAPVPSPLSSQSPAAVDVTPAPSSSVQP